MSYNQKIVFCGINGLSEGCFVSNDFFVSFDLVPYPRLNDGYIHFRLKLKKGGLLDSLRIFKLKMKIIII